MCFAEVDPMGWMPFAQLGSFGLIAMGLIWFFWKGAPLMMKKHEQIVTSVAESNKIAITKLADDFRHEAMQCRDERIQVAKDAAGEREKDRELRHTLNNTLQEVIAELHDRK